MRIRVRPLPLAALAVVVGLMDALRGLAGPASAALAFFPLFLAAASVAQLIASYLGFGFHQDFSTDHPAKGEPVRYALHVHNPLAVPLCPLVCGFTAAGPGARAFADFSPYLAGGASAAREETLLCSYRGVYAVGASSFRFRDILGVLELDYPVEPRVFHVYPEILSLGPGVEALAGGGGEGRPIPGGNERDAGVFESLIPLAQGRGGRIAWKRYAATGIPCLHSEGAVSAYGLRVVLDLRPSLAARSEDDRLAAEDLAVGAALSVLKRLVDKAVPAELVLGGEESAEAVEDAAAFDRIYGRSTSILFTDRRFPAGAFRGGRAVLLISTRSLAEEGEEGDLFAALEAARAKSAALLLLLVPPPSEAEAELERAELARSRLGEEGAEKYCRALDSRRGTEGVADVFAR